MKKILLIGGGGTIGTYVAKEMLEKGWSVDILCMEDTKSDHENLQYIQAKVTLDYLKAFLADRYYDAILNLLHHPVPEEYIAYHMVIAPKTDHEIFTSSIRAVGDAQHPLTETAPTLLDLVESGALVNPDFVREDDYSLPKARCERYLRQVSKYKNWTIVRPMISSSDKRLDLIQHTWHRIIEYAKEGKTLYVPEACRKNIAGLEWAGNTGRLIANLVGKPECMGNTYFLSTGHRLTWEDVAQVYVDLLGLKVEWIGLEEYEEMYNITGYALRYDRCYSRDVDNSAVLAATGLKKEELTPFKEGIRQELLKLGAI